MSGRWFAAAKWIVSIGVLLLIVQWFSGIENPEKIWSSITGLPLYIHSLAFLCAAANWILESAKWRYLLAHLQPISFPVSLKSTFSGAAVSHLIPFRVGEYLGRAFFLEEQNRIPALMINYFGAICQSLITLIIGIPAAYIMLGHQAQPAVHKALLVLLIVLIAVFSIGMLKPQWRRMPKWLDNALKGFSQLNKKQMFAGIGLSASRYLVFSGWYAFLITYTGIAPYQTAIMGVAAIFFLQTFTPGMVITDAAVRLALPALVFATPPAAQPLLLGIAVMNYFYNVLLPGFVGLVVILSQKRFRK